jgi:hypothetical protein
MATLRMPDRLVREVVSYYIASASPTRRSDDLLRMLISALGDLPVESAHIALDRKGRHADVVVDVERRSEFMTLFPGAVLLGEGARGTFLFRLSGADASGLRH